MNNDEDGSKHREDDDVGGVGERQAPVSGDLRDDGVPDTDQYEHRHRHHYVHVLQPTNSHFICPAVRYDTMDYINVRPKADE